MSDCEFTLKIDHQALEAIDEKIVLAMEKCGEVAEGYAQEKLRADKHIDSGRLVDSISHKVIEEGSDIECHIGTNVEYAPYIEFGTGIYSDKGGRKTPWVYKDSKGHWHRTHGIKPSHFLKKALADHKSAYIKLLSSFLKQS